MKCDLVPLHLAFKKKLFPHAKILIKLEVKKDKGIMVCIISLLCFLNDFFVLQKNIMLLNWLLEKLDQNLL